MKLLDSNSFFSQEVLTPMSEIMVCLVFNLFFLLIFLLVCCKQGLVAKAEAVLSFVIFWFNLLIWSHSFGVRVEARSILRNYGWNCE